MSGATAPGGVGAVGRLLVLEVGGEVVLGASERLSGSFL